MNFVFGVARPDYTWDRVAISAQSLNLAEKKLEAREDNFVFYHEIDRHIDEAEEKAASQWEAMQETAGWRPPGLR